MERVKCSMRVAGVDVGKAHLDVAIHGMEDAVRVANTALGVSELVGWLTARAVGRVGLEATGGYERQARGQLEAAGFGVVVHQPLEVRLFARLKRLKAKLLKAVLTQIRAHPDLGQRLRLLLSLPGVGPVVAASLVVRMPELGAMSRGQAASMLGVAPFDRDSGQYKGQRFIGGGRSRPRRLLYLAALSAKRCDAGLKAFAERLRNRGKPPKVIVTAVMRKLIEAANLVLARGQPWLKQCPV